MKILLCGANGQLGIEIQSILKNGFSDLGTLSYVYQEAELVCADVEELDITNEKAVLEFIITGTFDLIINCAAMTNVDGCEKYEEVAYRVNALGALYLARAADATGAKLLQISTDYVFSGEEAKEYLETDAAEPQSAYGRTKLAGEELVLGACKSSFVVRTAWLFGAQGPNFVKTIIELALQNGEITVVDDQYGNPTYAHDLAYELLQIAETDEYGIYHCTNKGICSWFEFASKIVDIAGIPCKKTPCKTEQFPRPAKRPTYSPLRNKRLEDTIGDKMREWPDALATYLSRTKLWEMVEQ